jgi:putative membrane protein
MLQSGELGARPGPAREMAAMMFWYGGHWAFWQEGLMWVGMIAFWGLLIWGLYALISRAGSKSGSRDDSGDARRILDRRLASGQIDAAEYRRLRDLIGATHNDASVRAQKGLAG